MVENGEKQGKNRIVEQVVGAFRASASRKKVSNVCWGVGRGEGGVGATLLRLNSGAKCTGANGAQLFRLRLGRAARPAAASNAPIAIMTEFAGSGMGLVDKLAPAPEAAPKWARHKL